jgi:hypothetical protein
MIPSAAFSRWLLALVPVVLASASLAYGSSFDLDAFDSAELALAAVSAGLAHPPGQPLHTMVGWLLTRGPWRPLSALAWLSIAPSVLTFALAIRAARREGEPVRAWLPWTAGLLLLVVGLGPVRDVSTRVEVYALAAALTVGAMLVTRGPRGIEPSSSLWAGLLWGLAGAVNPVIAAQGTWGVLAPVLARRRWGALAIVALSALFAVAVSYAYAFAAGARETRTLVWSAPSDLRSLGAVMLARDFAQNVSLGPSTFARNALAFVLDLTRSGVGVLLVVGFWGLVRRRDEVRDPWAAALIFAAALGVAMVAANVPYLKQNPDYGGYVLVPLALAVAGALRAAHGVSPTGRTALGGVLALVGLASAWTHGRPAGSVRAVAVRALEGCPPRAIAVLGADHLLFPALYLQTIEGVRPDVTVINPGWASSSWAWRWSLAKDPTLRVDLRPGLGRIRRLEQTLRDRAQGRAVLVERVESLALARRTGDSGRVCPLGMLWSTAEGCAGPSARSTVRTADFLRAASEQARARGAIWDRRVLWFSGASLGDGARALGCAGVAARLYAATLGERLPGPVASGCGSEPRVERESPDLLSIDEPVLRARLLRAMEDSSARR